MRLFPASTSQRALGGISGTIFVLAGTFKLFAPFGSYLETLHVPFAPLVGIGVPLLEIGGGATLLFGRHLPRARRKNVVQLACLGLAIDMIVAIALVGVPGRNGQTHSVSGHTIGSEPWRLPLEVFLLVVMLWFAWRPPIEES